MVGGFDRIFYRGVRLAANVKISGVVVKKSNPVSSGRCLVVVMGRKTDLEPFVFKNRTDVCDLFASMGVLYPVALGAQQGVAAVANFHKKTTLIVN